MTTNPTSRRTDVFQLLGLAHRAGAVVRGTDAVRKALQAGRVHLVIAATDAAPGQVRKIEGLLRARGVPRIVQGTRARLGQALGSPPLTAVGVTQEAWADRLRLEADATADRETSGPRAAEDDQTYAG